MDKIVEKVVHHVAPVQAALTGSSPLTTQSCQHSANLLKGPNAEYVKLVSSDKHEFIIRRSLATMSRTITAMMSGPGAFGEDEENIIHLYEIPSHVLSHVCEYFIYKEKYQLWTQEIPEFHIPPELSMDLLLAANYLGC